MDKRFLVNLSKATVFLVATSAVFTSVACVLSDAWSCFFYVAPFNMVSNYFVFGRSTNFRKGINTIAADMDFIKTRFDVHVMGASKKFIHRIKDNLK